MKTKLLPGIIRVVAFAICILFSVGVLHSQYNYSNLRVLDPRNSWWGPQGTIDTAIFVVEPKGIYVQVDMYLNFSAKGAGFDLKDTLEVQMSFNLPQSAIVNDSWLLIYGKWEKALILDRWTASTIYEGIVKRRKDPSILTKNNSGYYDLKVFPMAANESRKVKISFLIPFGFSNSIANIQLPFDILKLSARTTYSKILVKEAMGFKNPVIVNNPKVLFKPDANGFLAAIPESGETGVISFSSPMNNGVYLAKYEQNNGGIYQLALLPSEIISIDVARKLLILVDNEDEGYYTNTEITNSIKSIVRNVLHKNDSFNIIFSGLKTKKLSANWISVNGASTDSILNLITKAYYTGYSDLSSLLSDGLSYCESNGGTNVLLISNSDEFDVLKNANAFIDDLKANFKKLPVISIFDYDRNANGGIYNGSNYLYGNAYLYTVLSKSTSGSYYKLNYGESFMNNILSFAQSIGTYIPAFDMVSTLENGFCYGRMDVSNSLTHVYANKPVLTVGKYNGTFPLQLQISGFVGDSVFSKHITVDDSIAYDADTISGTIWAGNYIEEMEAASNLKNEEIAKIIEFSIENRILSLYTAFLTLEPDMVIEPCEDCNDEDGNPVVTSIDNKNTLSKIEIFGNPFRDQVRVKVSLDEEIGNDLNVQIYNAMGQLIRIMKVAAGSGYYEFTWDGKDQKGKIVSAGTYIIKMSAGNYSKSIKVMKK